MNYRMIMQILGIVLGTIAVVLLLPALICLIYGESAAPFLATTAITGVCSLILLLFRPKDRKIYAAEGFVSVGLAWILLSAFGALPFVLSGDIPSFTDAFFETVSGFTTTGSTNLTDLKALSMGGLFWRSLTHFLGGMGVLVFILAVLPMAGSRSMHIMRAEVPGYTVGKLVPSMRKTALLLYGIYFAMTVIETILLLCGGMNLFDAVIHAFGTAGTGGFSNRGASIGYYNSTYIDIVITVFMILFGVNFNLYFLILMGKAKDALKSEELRWYLGIILFCGVTIALNLGKTYGGFFPNLRYSFFQVASLMSSTGYGTADFCLWPSYSQAILMLLMFVGACAGSTGGGIKLGRFLIMGKAIRQELRQQLRPHSVNVTRLEGKVLADSTIHSTLVFFAGYFFLLFLGTLLVTLLDGLDITTTFTSVVTCLSNIGPGLGLTGPSGSFAVFSPLSKWILSFCMLLGRLEIFPILILFSPKVWKK